MPELYNTLFNLTNSSRQDPNDLTMELINQLHGHSDLNCISDYYDINTFNELFRQNTNNSITILHKF